MMTNVVASQKCLDYQDQRGFAIRAVTDKHKTFAELRGRYDTDQLSALRKQAILKSTGAP